MNNFRIKQLVSEMILLRSENRITNEQLAAFIFKAKETKSKIKGNRSLYRNGCRDMKFWKDHERIAPEAKRLSVQLVERNFEVMECLREEKERILNGR